MAFAMACNHFSLGTMAYSTKQLPWPRWLVMDDVFVADDSELPLGESSLLLNESNSQ